MYSLVACPDCKYSWIIDGRQKTTKCGGCGKTNQFDKLKKLYKSEEKEECRRARANLLAKQSGDEELFEQAVESGIFQEHNGIDQEELAEEFGFDTEELAAVEEEAMGRNRSLSQQDAIEAGITQQESPSVEEVVAFAEEHGVSAEKTREVIKKMKHRGTVMESSGGLRMV